MLVPMELTLMLEHMVPTTLARDLLMLSPRLMLMPTMVPMDTLHMVLLLMPIPDIVDILDLLDTLDTVPMVPILMLVLMVATTSARGLLMLSPRLMLMPTMVPMDTLHMVLLRMPILDTVDILDLLDILDTVPMVPFLMLVFMVATTLAKGLLMLSLRLMLMPTMVPMDTL